MIPYTLSGLAFPGDAALQDSAYEACTGRPFSDYVGTDYFDSALEVFIFTPTEESSDTGDRDVTCILYKLDLTKLTGRGLAVVSESEQQVEQHRQYHGSDDRNEDHCQASQAAPEGPDRESLLCHSLPTPSSWR